LKSWVDLENNPTTDWSRKMAWAIEVLKNVKQLSYGIEATSLSESLDYVVTIYLFVG
jgi:hypothetical protein